MSVVAVEMFDLRAGQFLGTPLGSLRGRPGDPDVLLFEVAEAEVDCVFLVVGTDVVAMSHGTDCTLTRAAAGHGRLRGATVVLRCERRAAGGSFPWRRLKK